MWIPPLTMKFGGTSVADTEAIARLVAHVAAVRRRGDPVLVVVSAMAGVTDRLLTAAAAAAARDATVTTHVDELRRRHLRTAAEIVGRGRAELEDFIDARIDDLRAVLRAVGTLRDGSPRALDSIAAIGELLSSRIVAAALQEAGIASVWVDARRVVRTDGGFTAAVPLVAEIAAAAERELMPVLAGGGVPVVGGFIGSTREGATTTLGRGGSDYTAALLGAAIRSHEIQIWTDVDGMLSADPRIVAQPRRVPALSFEEASELAYFGAKVLHPSTILPAIARNIPVRILNSRSEPAPSGHAGEGTLISSGVSADRAIAALACKRRVTVVDITSTRMLQACGFLRRLFEVFERHRTSVDVVTTSEVSVSVTLDDDRNLYAIVDELRTVAEVQVESGLAILCAVGDGLREDPGLATAMLGALDGFVLRMVSQAASRRNLTVVLREADLARAMTRLHDRFVVHAPASAAPLERV